MNGDRSVFNRDSDIRFKLIQIHLLSVKTPACHGTGLRNIRWARTSIDHIERKRLYLFRTTTAPQLALALGK